MCACAEVGGKPRQNAHAYLGQPCHDGQSSSHLAILEINKRPSPDQQTSAGRCSIWHARIHPPRLGNAEVLIKICPRPSHVWTRRCRWVGSLFPNQRSKTRCPGRNRCGLQSIGNRCAPLTGYWGDAIVEIAEHCPFHVLRRRRIRVSPSMPNLLIAAPMMLISGSSACIPR